MITSPPKVIDTQNLFQDWDKTRLFGGTYGGFQRFDVYRYDWIKKMTEIQRAAYWVPSEISMSNDRRRFDELPANHKTAFRKNLLFQTLADSVQSRGLQESLCQHVTDPSAENMFQLWAFFEGAIHSESYSHIVRGLYPDATKFFDSIQDYPEIADRFDKEAYLYNNWDQVYIPELMMRILLLEGIKFYVSFLVTYAINENNSNALQGVARIIRLIQNDENIHTGISGHIIRLGKEKPDELNAKKTHVQGWENTAREFARQTVADELAWWDYIKPHVQDIPILSDKGVRQFIEYRADKVMQIAGFEPLYERKKNELTEWFEQYSGINNQQVAAQEAEIISYQVGKLKDDL